MSIYNIDFSLTTERILPPDKRKPIILSYLTALQNPLQELHDEIFDVYRPDVIYRTRYNSQTIVLTEILNQTFDVNGTNGKIWIDNSDNNISIYYFYNDDEGYNAVNFSNSDETPLIHNYIFNEEEYVLEFDAFVNVPYTWIDSDSNSRTYSAYVERIKAEIDKYIIMGVNYKVQPY